MVFQAVASAEEDQLIRTDPAHIGDDSDNEDSDAEIDDGEIDPLYDGPHDDDVLDGDIDYDTDGNPVDAVDAVEFDTDPTEDR